MSKPRTDDLLGGIAEARDLVAARHLFHVIDVIGVARDAAATLSTVVEESDMPKARARAPAPTSTRPLMRGYGLPKTSKGLLPWRWAEARLDDSRQYWIATVRPNGAPHVMVVWALWLDGFLYFSTGSKSRKARNLALNPRCTMCTQTAAEAVVLEGEVETETRVPRIREFLRRYAKKYAWDMSKMNDDLVTLKEPLFRLRPRIGFGLAEKTFSTSATRWIFK
jgi:hypothetical protein